MLTGIKINLVRPTSDDWENVNSIWKDASVMTDGGGRAPLSQARYLEWWKSTFRGEAEDGRYFMIMDPANKECFGEIGFEGYSEETKQASLCLFVKSEFRGRHFGAEAIDLLMDLFFAVWKAETLECGVRKDNANGLEIMRHMGFAETRLGEDKVFLAIDREGWVRRGKS